MSSQDPSPGGGADGASGSNDAKTARKQGVSCDACKFRKVRCDRRAKLEASPDRNPREVACTVCSQHGLRCTFTQTAPRRRRGKRIVAIQKSQLGDTADTAERLGDAEYQQGRDDDLDDAAADEIAAAAAAQSTAEQARRESSEPLFGFDHEQLPDVALTHIKIAGSRSKSTSASRKANPTPSTHQNLFGISGLTRPLLDACVRAYFKYASPCQPILHVEIFSIRYALFFALFEENQGVVPSVSINPTAVGPEHTPLSLVTILAVGCVGAALLEPPIAASGSMAKFRLQDRMALRFQQMMQEKDLMTRLKEEGADVLEACYVMSDSPLKVLGNEDRSNNVDFEERVSQTPASIRAMLDPLKMNPSTAEAVVKLLFTLGLNRRPKPRKGCLPGDARTWTSGGVAITESEVFRRTRIFWTAFMQDSFRSPGARKNVLIGDDDYDLDLPRIVPQADGLYTTVFSYSDHETESSIGSGGLTDFSLSDSRRSKDGAPARFRQSRSARFDALQLEVMLRLAFVIRTVSIRFVSPRAQGRGVLITDVERATSSLNAWWKQVPQEVSWNSQVEPLLRAMREGQAGSNNAIALRNSIKSLFVEMLYHGNVLAVFGSVNDYGIRFEVDMTEAVHLFATRLGLEDKTGLPVKNTVAENLEQRGRVEERKRQARAGMDRLAAFSLCRVAETAKEAGLIGILRANRSVFMNICSSYALWGCGLAQRIAETGQLFGVEAPHGRHPAEFTLACVEDILFGLGTVDSFEGAPDIVQQIKGMLQKTREGVQATCGPLLSPHGMQSTSRSEEEQAYRYGPIATQPPPQQQAPGPAFHQFYRRGGPHDGFEVKKKSGHRSFGSTQASPSPVYTSPASTGSSAETDEVSVLARAALPHKAGQTIRHAASSSALSSTSTSLSPDHAYNTAQNAYPSQSATYGAEQSTNLNMNAMSGLDTTWLQDYLGMSDPDVSAGSSAHLRGGNVSTQPTISASMAAAAPSYAVDTTSSYYGPWSGANPPAAATAVAAAPLSAFGQPLASADAVPRAVHQQQASVFGQGPPYTHYQHDTAMSQHFAAPIAQMTSQAAGTDMQWDQLMAGAGDAQIWAESQWQGFQFNPPPTHQQ